MSFVSRLRHTVAGHSIQPITDTNNGSLHSLDAVPPDPLSLAATATARHFTTTSVDLAASPRQSRPPNPPETRANADRARLSKHTRSADEKRLTGDFHVPADSVFAPDPTSYFRTTMGKPTSSNSFQPVDTLSGPRVTAKPILYGRTSRKPPPGQGQRAFLDVHSSPGTPGRRSSSRSLPAGRAACPSPSKRRKTNQQVIDLIEDDDVQEISSQHVHTSPTLGLSGLPQSSQSTCSQPSAASGRTPNGKLSKRQIRNEFQEVEGQMQVKRRFKRQQTPSRRHPPSIARSASGSVTPRPQRTPVHVLDRDSDTARGTARVAILQDLMQGVLPSVPVDRKASHRAEETTSHHFPKARINETTTAPTVKMANIQQNHSESKDLRTFRWSNNIVDMGRISEDELGMDLPRHRPRPTKKRGPECSTLQTPNTFLKRKLNTTKPVQHWPLKWARNLDFDSLDLPKSEKKDDRLHLRSDPENHVFHIVAYADSSGDYETQASITPQHVVRVWLDDTSRIRLEGSRTQDGNRRTVDLEFRDTKDFQEFRDTHVAALSGHDIPSPRPENYMQLLFGKPLPKNNKVGSLPLIENGNSEVNSGDASHAQLGIRSLWEQMKTNPSAQSSARPTRSTRASAPAHDVHDISEESQMERYSEIHGLGKAWRDPLSFSHDRYRAYVNFGDLQRLDEGEFLNDNLIDFYMIYCFKQSNVPRDKVFLFNTFFYSKLTENTGRASMNYKAVESWTSKIDIFSYDYIVVPIHQDAHWYLAIISNIGNINRKAIEENFDEGTAHEVIAETGMADAQEISTVTEVITEPKLVDTAPDAFLSVQVPLEREDNEVNLFDEQSELDLVDSEDVGTVGEAEPQTSAHTSPMLQPQMGEATSKVPSIFQQTDDAAQKTVLSNLSTLLKKNSKRRTTATKRDPKQPVIIVLDSLSLARSPAVRALKDWLAAEGKKRRGMEALIREKGYYPKGDQIPVQNNFSDCGVYLLGYAEKFFRDPDEFVTKLLQGDMTAEQDWPQLKPQEMRNNFRDILFKLASEQQLTLSKKERKMKALSASSVPKRKTVEATTVESAPSSSQALDAAKSTMVLDVAKETISVAPGSVMAPEEPSHQPVIPKLGSPFTPKLTMQSSVSISEGPQAAEKPVLSAPALPAESTVVGPGPTQTPERRTHPEIRIMKRSPASQQVPQSHQIQTSLHGAPVPSPLAKPVSRSISPLKRTRQLADDNGSPKSLKKKTAASAGSAERKRESSRFEEVQGGHSDNPIEITDSQDLKPAATQSSQPFHRGSSVQREQPPRSYSTVEGVRRSLSIEEMSSVSFKTVQPKHPFPDLEMSTDSGGYGDFPPELMIVDSPNDDPMEIDDIIRETPSPIKCSPPPE